MNQRGFSLLELLITIALIGVVGTMALAAVNSGCGKPTPPGYYEDEAKEWAQAMGYKIQGVQCMSRDTDMDGYVSCTVALVDSREPIAIECADSSINRGCRIPKAKARSQ